MIYYSSNNKILDTDKYLKYDTGGNSTVYKNINSNVLFKVYRFDSKYRYHMGKNTFEMLKKGAGIVFHGLNDPWCKTEIADARSKELGLELHKIDRANHSLETDSPMEDLVSLQEVMKRVESFL